MSAPEQRSKWYREYDLTATRKVSVSKTPAVHQNAALSRLAQWYESGAPELGGILVLPTGGGKTFTATHFMCKHPLSKGFKVLWLAHTHHLLEQAFEEFAGLVGLIEEPRTRLCTRVVSGTTGHFPVHSIRPTDDVVVCSLQTAGNALNNQHKNFEEFLDAAKGRLFIVFDEAHHSPAPSFRSLIIRLRDRYPRMQLLGLTATPTYGDEKKRGWLLKLFPQGILHQVQPNELMAAGILARPYFEETTTNFEANFDDREYQKWVGTNRDLPEEIVTTLATTQERNDYIVGYYLQNREKYGKTIIFADRWFQCDYLREMLRSRGVRADVVYSHVDADPGSAEARNKRAASENARVLGEFRQGNLDVLINVRMLTEGTDVPQVQSVFITRQTTSQILLTQMVGRALRGTKFGGTDRAYIVSFIDNWKQRINWAAYDQLAPGIANDEDREYGKRPPLQLISIDLVRRLARQMDSGINVNPGPYQTLLPIGWYRVEYMSRVEGTDDQEEVSQLLIVFDGEKPGFEAYVEELGKLKLTPFESENIKEEAVGKQLDIWKRKFFATAKDRVGGSINRDLLAIARHMAQGDKSPPKFFPFEARAQHDLDAVAQLFIDQKLDPIKIHNSLLGEYGRQDRFWHVFYPNERLFKSHFDACMNRILDALREGADPKQHTPKPYDTPEELPDREPTEEVKAQVKSRDGYRCLCCLNANRRQLQVDHIHPSYHGGRNQLDNLQTLCTICNSFKGTETINFRINRTPLRSAPQTFLTDEMLGGTAAREPAQWEMFLRHSINFFYRCAAVESVKIGQKGEGFRQWQVRLFAGNDPKWLDAHLPSLIQRIRDARQAAGYEPAPNEIKVSH